MWYWWRIVKVSVILSFKHPSSSLIVDFATNTNVGKSPFGLSETIIVSWFSNMYIKLAIYQRILNGRFSPFFASNGRKAFKVRTSFVIG
jgi:hypothetical protein